MVWNKRVVNPHDVINGIEVVREVESKNGRRRVEAVCPYCQKLFTTALNYITKKHTKSCGCQKYTGLVKRTGADSNLFVHGLYHHPLHVIWYDMRQRCGVVKGADEYKAERYEKRGITVCDEWRDDFMAFYNWAIANGWKKGLQLDRKDNNKGYSPDNCQWVTPSENCRNRRNSYKYKMSGYGHLYNFLEQNGVPIYVNGHHSKWEQRYRRDLREAGCVQGFLFPLNAR